MSDALDIARNRRELKWTHREQLARVAWGVGCLLFRASPRIFWGFRRALLRTFGARIGGDVRVHPGVSVWMPWNIEIEEGAAVGDRAILYALGPMTIGKYATISQGAHLCGGSHDFHRRHMPLLKCSIVVGEGVWICADAFIGPDVMIGPYAVVGARAVAMDDVPPWTIVAGNPAVPRGKRPQFTDV